MEILRNHIFLSRWVDSSSIRVAQLPSLLRNELLFQSELRLQRPPPSPAIASEASFCCIGPLA